MTTSGSTTRKDVHDVPGGVYEEAAAIKELIINGSIELSAGAPDVIDKAREFLPFGKPVYMPSLPKHPPSANLETIARLYENGFEAIPHVAARRLSSSRELGTFLEQIVRDYGVRRVLLVGGDIKQSKGPYDSSADVLRDGVLQKSGITQVGLAAYPEGHPHIPQHVLKAALNEKVELLNSSGSGAYFVTQFSFAPARIIRLCSEMQRDYPGIPVYVGMAGPTDPARLLRFAKICGVSSSLRALMTLGFKSVKMIAKTEPNDQLTMLANYCAKREQCNIVGIHVFSFGGFLEAAMWKFENLR